MLPPDAAGFPAAFSVSCLRFLPHFLLPASGFRRFLCYFHQDKPLGRSVFHHNDSTSPGLAVTTASVPHFRAGVLKRVNVTDHALIDHFAGKQKRHPGG